MKGVAKMKFFKLMLHSHEIHTQEDFEKQYCLKFKSMIFSKSGYSFGFSYSPNEYQEFTRDENNIRIIIDNSIKQQLITNWIFYKLVDNLDEFGLKLVDCKIFDADFEDIVENLDELIYKFQSIFVDGEYRLKELTLKTSDYYQIVIMRNGVIGVDEEVVHSKSILLQKLIDFLGYGIL